MNDLINFQERARQLRDEHRAAMDVVERRQRRAVALFVGATAAILALGWFLG